jgi:hypothetical protein
VLRRCLRWGSHPGPTDVVGVGVALCGIEDAGGIIWCDTGTAGVWDAREKGPEGIGRIPKIEEVSALVTLVSSLQAGVVRGASCWSTWFGTHMDSSESMLSAI